MKTSYYLILMFLATLICVTTLNAQVFDGEWSTQYVTNDDSDNGTGTRTIAVGPIAEDYFFALCNRARTDPGDNAFYLIGYNGADSTSGRMWDQEYSPLGFFTQWVQGFTQIPFFEPKDLDATSDSLIYVANNDPDNNILVFQATPDTFLSTTYRLKTQAGYLWAIDVDADGKVYVTQVDTAANQSTVLVYDNFANEGAWVTGAAPTALQTIILPEAGYARGIAVSQDGTVLYVSNWDSKKVYRYTGDPVGGYTQDTAFDFMMESEFTSNVPETIAVGPWGLEYVDSKNILCVAADASFVNETSGYQYGRMYFAHFETGEILDTIDVAEWNFTVSGSYSSPALGTSSSYAGTYDVQVGPDLNIYSVSYYGWDVQKWLYSGELPVLTDIKIVDNIVPTKFSLDQNFPNPFNPSTTIQFSITELSNVKLAIYSITGELVDYVINGEELATGTYKVSYDASKLASGIYIYTLTNGNNQISKKMTLLK